MPRKALNLALSYYPVARECLLAVVDSEQKGWLQWDHGALNTTG